MSTQYIADCKKTDLVHDLLQRGITVYENNKIIKNRIFRNLKKPDIQKFNNFLQQIQKFDKF